MPNYNQYNPYMSNSYQSYAGSPNYYSQPTNAFVQPAQTSNTFAWVQGEAAAKAYPVPPGTTMILMDTENPVLYMKFTDQSGRPQDIQTRYLVTKEEFDKLQNGSISAEQSVNFVTRSEFESFVKDANDKFVIRKDKRNG